MIDEYRRRHTLKRDVTRERRFAAGDADAGPVQFPSDEPTASQFAQANEVHERLLDRQDETERHDHRPEAARLLNGGYRRQTGWNIRKVQRFLKDLHDSLDDPGE